MLIQQASDCPGKIVDFIPGAKEVCQVMLRIRPECST